MIGLAIKNQKGASEWANQMTHKFIKNTTSIHLVLGGGVRRFGYQYHDGGL